MKTHVLETMEGSTVALNHVNNSTMIQTSGTDLPIPGSGKAIL